MRSWKPRDCSSFGLLGGMCDMWVVINSFKVLLPEYMMVSLNLN